MYGGIFKMKRLFSIFSLFLICLCLGQVFAINDTDLVSWYKLYDNISDSTGLNNCTTNNGAIFTGGDYATFDGNDYIECPDIINDISTNTQGSISLWFNANTLSGTDTLIGVADNGAINSRSRLDLTDGDLFFKIRDSSSGFLQEITSDSTLSTSTTYHVVITQDGTTGKMYINGVLQIDTGNSQWWNDMSLLDRFNIGTDGYTETLFYNGDIWDVAVWDDDLNQTEVTDLYNGGSAFTYEDLVGSTSTASIEITNISVNDETFINNTVFDINDLYFNVTYQYNNTEYGNGTNSTQFTLLDLDNGVYNQYIEVCTNSSNTTCDARNITFTINVTTAIVFNSIKFNNDELSLIEENYFNTNNLFINIILQNISTNGDINTKFSLYQSDAPWQLIDSRFFMFNALTGGTNISSVLTDNTNYRIFFFAENNETETTTGYYYFTLDSISPVISHNIPTEINNYNLAGISITVTDTNAGTCIINIEDTNFTCSSFTGYNFTTNGYKNWTITATDLAGNQRVATGQLLVNPLAVYSFYDIVNLEYVQNYTFGGYSSVGRYVEIPIYDLGLGSHSLEFYKLGYNSSSYNVEFTDTSNINKSFNVTPVRIEIRVYNQVTNELINTTVNLDLIGTTNINQSTLTGIFNITSYVAPGEYQVFISSSDYVSNQLSFTYTSVDLIKENIYLIPSNYSLAGYVNIITYNKDNTYASEIPVIAYEWDSSTSSYKQTYKTQSDTNGKAVIFVILQDKIYKFCAEYTTGTVCFPGGTQGQIIPVSQNGDTFPILPVLNFPQVTTSFKDLDFGIQTNLTNYSSSFFNYTLDYIWSNRNGLSVTICTKLVKDFNYSTQTIVDSCLTQPSGEYIHSFLLNNSFSYILTVYQKLGTEKVELYSERVNGEDSFWGALDYFNIKNLFIIVLICIMLGVIPLLKNSFLIVGDVLLVVFILWKYIIPQSLSITSVGVIIVMALLTLWGLSKK